MWSVIFPAMHVEYYLTGNAGSIIYLATHGQGHAVDPQTPEHSGVEVSTQNCSGVGFRSGIDNKARGLSHRMQ